MLSLAQLAMSALPLHEWQLLDRHIQECVFPPTRGVAWLQRRLLQRRHARMAAFLELLKPQNNPTLAPQNIVLHLATSAYRVVRGGDHLVVMVGGGRWSRGVAHHGIALGPNGDGTILVADFSHVVAGNVLKICSLQSFIGLRRVFGVVPQSTQERDMAVQRAKALIALQEHGQLEKALQLLGWNCETFAMVCVTGPIQPSEQARKLLDAITHDLRKDSEQKQLAALLLRNTNVNFSILLSRLVVVMLLLLLLYNYIQIILKILLALYPGL